MQDDQPLRDGAPPPLGKSSILLRLGAIGAVLAATAGGFAYAGGWFSPKALTQAKIINTFQDISGVHEGFRRNHAKGLCATATFASNGQGARLSKASVFESGLTVPVIARFSLAGGQPYAADAETSVKAFGLRFVLPGGEEWRTAMIPLPVFPVRTPEAFWEQLEGSKPDPATGKPDPAKMQAFLAEHPETAKAISLIKAAPASNGFADTTFHGLNAFLFTNADGTTTPIRWSIVPEQGAPKNAALGTDKNALFDALIQQVAQQPIRWHLVLTVGQPGDPTNDATIPWPDDREQVDAGILTVSAVVDEDDGACTNINYDPLVLPNGIEPSDDPLLSARSAAYSESYTRRAGETKPPSAITAEEISKERGQ